MFECPTVLTDIRTDRQTDRRTDGRTRGAMLNARLQRGTVILLHLSMTQTLIAIELSYELQTCSVTLILCMFFHVFLN